MPPQLPQMDLALEQKAARQKAEPRTQIYDPETSQGLPAQSVSARGQDFLSAGKGMQELGGVVQDLAEEQIKAQQTTWLLNTKSNYELHGQNVLNDLIAKAQPGQPISGQLQKQLQQTQQEGGKNIVSPRLQSGYASATEGAQTSLMRQAQEFDNKQRSEYAAYNFDQAMLANQNLLTSIPSYDGVKTKYDDLIGEVGHTVDGLPVAPDVKLKLRQAAISGLGVAANQKMQDLDPQRWLQDHSNAMSPEAKILAGPLLPPGIRNNNPGNLKDETRGERNNNPGNLTGNDQWQGAVGKDEGGYIKFDTPENGLRALSKNLVNQQDLHGLNTVNDIISKYAPPSENDTAAYVLDVSHKLGVDPHEKIDLHNPQTLAAMTDAVTHHENGSQPHSQQAIQAATTTALGSPATTQGSINTTSNNSFNMLDYDTQHKLMNQGVQSLKAEITAKESALNMQEKMQKLQADKIMKQNLIQAHEAYSSNDPAKMQELVKNVVHDPNLNFAQSEQVLSMVNTTNERGAKTDPAVFNSLLSRTLPNSNNPMTDPNEPMSYVGHGIGYEDAIHLQSRIEHKGEPIEKQKDKFFDMGKSMISQSTMIAKDPEGDRQAYNWYVYVNHLMEKKIKDSQGKITIDDMTTEGNKEYLGNTINQFVRSPQQQIQDMANRLRGAQSQQPPLPPEQLRKSGENIDDYLARTKKK